MKKALFYIVILLTAVATLCSCTRSPAANTSVQTPPSADAAAIYQDAAQRIGTAQDLTVNTTMTQQVISAGQSFSISTEEQVTYLELNTDAFASTANKTVNYGDYETVVSESYANGNVYTTILESRFSAPIPAEAYKQRYTPACIVTAENYATVTIEDNTITFADPLQAESWLCSEEITLTSASASATLDSNGNLQSAEYTATYTYGGAQITKTVTQTISMPKSSIVVTVPSDADTYTQVSSIDALLMLEQAYGYVHQSSQMSAVVSKTTYTQAAGYSSSSQANIDTYHTNAEPMIQVEQSSNTINYTNGENTSTTLTELYRDGQYTISKDGGRSTTNVSVTADDMRDYYLSLILELILELDYINGGTCTDLGSVYLAEYTCSELLAQDYCREICNRLFNNENLLSDMASAYKTNKLEYYVAMDKYTGLPTALGLSYEGVHTIEGVDYVISEQAYCSLDLASVSSYTTITDEIDPDTEPESKPTPLFYRVTGQQGQQMWLFGTIHVGDDRTGFLPQEIYDALNGSDALAIECDSEAFEKQLKTDPALQSAVASAYYYTGAKTSAYMQDQQLYANAMRWLKATGSYNASIESMKMSVWEQSISNFYLRQGGKLSREKGMEMRLTRIAKKENTPIWEVETSLGQLQMLTGFSDPLQEMLLSATVSTSAKSHWEDTQHLYELWCSGDEAALRAYINRETEGMTEAELTLYPEYQKAMHADRNAHMTQVAQQYLESGNTVFYAVGLAHLLAEDGLVNTLRAAGYTVELVPYQ